jgi:hypothetical protein
MNKGEKKEFGKGKKMFNGEAHIGQVWDSSEESSSNDEGLATMAMEAHTLKSSLFGKLTDEEEDYTPICLMSKVTKVYLAEVDPGTSLPSGVEFFRKRLYVTTRWTGAWLDGGKGPQGSSSGSNWMNLYRVS